jgi:hypothetical protein
MKKIKSQLLFTLVFGFLNADAQDTTSLCKTHPKVSTGTITEITYGFGRRKTNFSQFQFSIGYSRLRAKLEEFSVTANFKLKMHYSHNRILFQKNNWKYYLGPKAMLEYSGCFFPQWDESHLYWADYFSLAANNIFSYRLKNENEWLTSLSFPLLSFYSRPDYLRLYKIDDTSFGGVVNNLNRDIKSGFWGNAFQLHVETSYRFPAFKNKTEVFFYSFEYIRIKKNDGNPFTQLSHQIGIKLLL